MSSVSVLIQIMWLFLIKYNIFLQTKYIWSVIGKMAAILLDPRVLHENTGSCYGLFAVAKSYVSSISDHMGGLLSSIPRDRFVYAPSKWETTLHCNVAFHWLGVYNK